MTTTKRQTTADSSRFPHGVAPVGYAKQLTEWGMTHEEMCSGGARTDQQAWDELKAYGRNNG